MRIWKENGTICCTPNCTYYLDGWWRNPSAGGQFQQSTVTEDRLYFLQASRNCGEQEQSTGSGGALDTDALKWGWQADGQAATESAGRKERVAPTSQEAAVLDGAKGQWQEKTSPCHPGPGAGHAAEMRISDRVWIRNKLITANPGPGCRYRK